MRVALLVLAAGCLRSNLVDCGDGFLCPPALVCAPDDTCVLETQVLACAGHADGGTCTVLDARGACASGVCVTADAGTP